MIDELNKLMEDHRDEVRRLPNLRAVVKSLCDLTKQANMKEASLRTIAELCYLKEGHKDQRDMMREISDKDRVSVEKYMTRFREERPPPAASREPVTEPCSPARQLARPSTGSNAGSIGNRAIGRTSAIGRGIQSPRGGLQFTPRSVPRDHQQQQQMEHLNAVNNNNPLLGHHLERFDNYGSPPSQGGFADPCGTLYVLELYNRLFSRFLVLYFA